MRKPTSFYFFNRKPIVLKDRYECWRGVADLLGFATQERLRVCLYNLNLSLDPEELNPGLTERLIEYNFTRPQQSLGCLAPAEYMERELAKIHSPVLPMWSAGTGSKSATTTTSTLGNYSNNLRTSPRIENNTTGQDILYS